MDEQQAKFDGWAIVEILGRQTFVGYVTTEAYGQAVLFRIDVPALGERERVVKGGEYIGGQWCPPGTTVKEGPVQGYTKLVGSGSIYCITPTTEDAALLAVDRMQHRPLMAVTLPPERALPEPEQIRDVNDDDPNEADDDIDDSDDDHAAPI